MKRTKPFWGILRSVKNPDEEKWNQEELNEGERTKLSGKWVEK
ncbi:hypothetical protein [Haladaptatus sp. W1]|nr:hypothetical protein [Haladaptatus sp. W1]